MLGIRCSCYFRHSRVETLQSAFLLHASEWVKTFVERKTRRNEWVGKEVVSPPQIRLCVLSKPILLLPIGPLRHSPFSTLKQQGREAPLIFILLPITDTVRRIISSSLAHSYSSVLFKWPGLKLSPHKWLSTFQILPAMIPSEPFLPLL